MSQTSHEHDHPANGTAPDDAGRHIEGATDEIFPRAQDALRDVADRATHLAQYTLEHGRAGVQPGRTIEPRREFQPGGP